MRTPILYFLCVVTLFFLKKSEAKGVVILKLGQTKIFSARPEQKIYIKNEKVIQIEDKNNKIYARAINPGVTVLRIGNRRHSIYVYSPSLYIKISQLKELLKNFLGLKLRYKNNSIEVFGTLYRISDWIQISKIFKSCTKKEYSFTAQIETELHLKAYKLIRKYLKKNYFLTTQIKIDKYLRVIAPKDSETAVAPALCQFGVPIEYNDALTKNSKNIKIKIQFIESQSKKFEHIGVKWNGHIGAQLLPQFINQSRLESLLLAQDNNGKSQMLASPEMIVQNGKFTDFFVGGEFPVQIKNKRNSFIKWKPHGISLKIKPELNESGKINLDIQISVSSLDSPSGTNQAPSLKITRIKNSITISNKQFLILNKIYTNNNGFSKENLPYLKKLPILGSLFRSQSYLNNKTNLYILISSEVLND